MLKDLIKQTRSYRSFTTKEITENELLDMIEGARFSGATANIQGLRYILVKDKKVSDFIFSTCKFAGFLDWNPTIEEAPTAYIIICTDNDIALSEDRFWVNAGIASQNIMLLASEMGYGGCLVGAFNKPKIDEYFNLANKYSSKLIIALGEPAEKVEVVEAKDGATKYYKKDNIHYVPKLSVEELIIK